MLNLSGLSSTATERYFFINEEKTWAEAVNYCRQHHTDLASVRNHTENSVIQQVVPADKMAAIGLHRHTWIWWSDNIKPTFKNWADGHPLSGTSNCAASVINSTYLGKWVESPCDEKFHFMCHNSKLFSSLNNIIMSMLHYSKVHLNTKFKSNFFFSRKEAVV